MDTALCTLDNSQWIASDFIALSNDELQTRRRNLVCSTCGGDAWFRKSSYGNKSPHFCAHHINNCIEATTYEVIGEGDGGDGQPASEPDSGIIIDLGLDKDYSIEINKKETDMHIATGQQRSPNQIIDGGGIDYPAHLTLKNILYKLARSDKLYLSDTKVTLPDDRFPGLPDRANKLFVNFKDINDDLNHQKRIYWGFISDAGYTQDGRLWLNAGRRTDGLSVSINPEITELFREYFKVKESLEQLAGCHALIIGDCYYTSKGKPVIWCANLDFIVLRRYNFDTEA
jgi:hypothetical protein